MPLRTITAAPAPEAGGPNPELPAAASPGSCTHREGRPGSFARRGALPVYPLPAVPPSPARPPLPPDLSRAVVSEIAETVGRRLEERLQDLLPDLLAGHLTPPAAPPLLGVSDVAARLNVSARTVERIVASGQLRPLWIEGQRRFTVAAVEAYLKACAKQPANGRPRRRSR